MVPVEDLRLNSHMGKQPLSGWRLPSSHLCNDGVKALVDSICERWALGDGKPPACVLGTQG